MANHAIIDSMQFDHLPFQRQLTHVLPKPNPNPHPLYPHSPLTSHKHTNNGTRVLGLQEMEVVAWW
jgi:hypothetical protein